MGKYIVRNGVLAGRKFRLEAGARIVLGREKGDLNFPDKRMSRTHCVLEVREDGDYLEDANATNGTFVNDEKVKLRALKPGDIIRVGFTEIEYLGMPEHVSLGLTMEPGQIADPNKTIAFRRDGLEAAAGPKRGSKRRRRSRARSRMDQVKRAAMGISGGVKLISAKGKFCEACGEAIFMKEGAPDEGRVIDGLYLCRMCALIVEKQKGTDGDFLPSYAKIVGGRMAGPGAGGAAGDSDQLGLEIASVEEVSLDDLIGDGPLVKEEAEETLAAPAGEKVEQGSEAEAGVAAEAEIKKEPEEKLEEMPEEMPEEKPEEKAGGKSEERAEEELDKMPETEPERESRGPAAGEERERQVEQEAEAKGDDTVPRSAGREAASRSRPSTETVFQPTLELGPEPEARDASETSVEAEPVAATEDGSRSEQEAGGPSEGGAGAIDVTDDGSAGKSDVDRNDADKKDEAGSDGSSNE